MPVAISSFNASIENSCVFIWTNDAVNVSCSVQLEKERQQREDAEKQKRELEDRLRKYEDEFEKAKLGQFLIYYCNYTVTYTSSMRTWHARP